MTDNYSNLKIGLLALQGDYAQHRVQLERLGVANTEVRQVSDLEGLSGLIIPGGESTTMSILLDRFDLREPLRQFVRSKPVYGTCAGMIMLATGIEENQSAVEPLGVIDIDVIRNGYGRQRYSAEKMIELNLKGQIHQIKASFIRAPKITRTGENVEILLALHGSPVLVRQGQALASAFHAELYDDMTLTKYFLSEIVAAEN